MLKTISAPTCVPPHGHYSHAVVHNGVVYVSGLLGNSREALAADERSIELQAQHCLDQMASILNAASSDMNHVLKLNVFISRVELWPKVNSVCERAAVLAQSFAEDIASKSQS